MYGNDNSILHFIDSDTQMRFTGSDEFNARAFRSAKTECTSRVTILVCANSVVKFDDLDPAMRNRILIWQLKARFVPEGR